MSNPKHRIPSNEDLKLERCENSVVDRTWSDTELERMLAICQKRGREDYSAMLRLARNCGLRIEECHKIDTAIARNAIRKIEITISGKNGKIRTIPLK